MRLQQILHEDFMNFLAEKGKATGKNKKRGWDSDKQAKTMRACAHGWDAEICNDIGKYAKTAVNHKDRKNKKKSNKK